jgi:peptide/nickel transport system ATP-binding protein
MSAPDDIALAIEDLRTEFRTDDGTLRAVDGVNLSLRRGRVLAVVGESGCGKTVTAYSILRLIRPPGHIAAGSIVFRPRQGAPVDLAALGEKSPALRAIRGGRISMIFQEPMSALSPVHTVGNQIDEALLLHGAVSPAEARRRTVAMLRRVGIPAPERRAEQYPHELSGGMRQRVVIAMALVCNPEILIADEPTTALDVTVQAQILALIKELQAEQGASVLFITHDLGVVAQMADEVAVMYLGRVVESGPVREVLKNPRHPYTAGLLASRPGHSAGRHLPVIAGSVPSLSAIPPGCPFHPRCPHQQAGQCDVGGPPPLAPVTPSRRSACLREKEIFGDHP